MDDSGTSLAALPEMLDYQGPPQEGCAGFGHLPSGCLLKAHSIPLTEHSSDKSSQDRHRQNIVSMDRLSQMDARTGVGDGMDWGTAANSPVSSKLKLSALQPGEQIEPARSLSRRVRVKLPANVRASPDVEGTISPLIATTSKSQLSLETVSKALANIGGNTAAEKALSARRLGESAAKEAETKAKRAAKLIAAAHQKAKEASRASKRRRLTQPQLPKLGSSGNLLMGSRISVYWSEDKMFYKGRVAEVNEEEDLQRVEYDDEAQEWLSLADERFQLVLPRAVSAGCTPAFIEELKSLDPETVPQAAPQPARPLPPPAGGELAVNWRLQLRCPADGTSHMGHVLAFRSSSSRHHILYADGEDEWVTLAAESLQWLERTHAGFHSQPPTGHEAPMGEAAIGWRLAVYWKSDQAFYQGTVNGFDASMGRHHVVYTDGDEERLHLGNEHVKWLSPPEGASMGVQATRQKLIKSCSPGKRPRGIPMDAALANLCPRPKAGGLRRARTQPSLNRYSTRVPSIRKSGSVESVSEMLKRVEAEEAALMSDIDPQRLGTESPSSMVTTWAEGSPYSQESAESTAAPAEVGLKCGATYWHSFAAGPAPLPSIVLERSTALPAWHLDLPSGSSSSLLPSSASWNVHAFLKSEHFQPVIKPCEAAKGPLIDELECGSSMPTAPSPSPLLESVLPTTFSGEASLLLPGGTAGELSSQMEAAALPPVELETGNDLLDVFMSIPTTDVTSSSWWQSM